jgi:hypothetical protein
MAVDALGPDRRALNTVPAGARPIHAGSVAGDAITVRARLAHDPNGPDAALRLAVHADPRRALADHACVIVAVPVHPLEVGARADDTLAFRRAAFDAVPVLGEPVHRESAVGAGVRGIDGRRGGLVRRQ